jgi:DNA-binding NarL/FixJ family response regulator
VKEAGKILATEAGEMSVSHPAGTDRRVIRVWIADDQRDLRELFGELLNKQPGIRCRRWFSSAEAVLKALAEERPPDMILLDINMGRTSGLDAIGPIRQLAPSVKILMWTMFSNSHYEAEAFRAGAAGFLLKTYEAPEIVALLHEARANPGSAALFPSLSLNGGLPKNVAELVPEPGVTAEKKPFSLAGAFRQFCRRRAPSRGSAA